MKDPTQLAADKLDAAKWAYDLMQQGFNILDLETTGFGKSEAIETAIVNQNGRIVFSTLIKPTILIPPKAMAVNGITDAMVEKAPSYPEIAPALSRWIDNAHLVIYNSPFDLAILTHCSSLHELPMVTPSHVHCAMRQYAKFVNEWNPSKSSYRWHKLTGGDHTAAGDCLATLELMREMAVFYQICELPEFPFGSKEEETVAYPGEKSSPLGKPLFNLSEF